MKTIVWILIVVVIIVGVVMLTSNKETSNPLGSSSAEQEVTQQDTMEQQSSTENSTIEEESVGQSSGSYETYSFSKLARAEEGDVILFFHADWCPSCRALENDIEANLSSIPSEVTILKTNYDTETALRQKYGITYQHTLVQVDSDGNMIAKWSGSPTLAALLQAVK